MQIIEVTNLDHPELTIYTERSEKQLATIYEPKEGLFIAESPKVIERALDAGYEPVSFLAEKGQLKEAENIFDRIEDIPVYIAPDEQLAELTGYHLTRGLWCAMRRKTLPALEEVCRDARRIVILEEVVNPTNVGALFRCAAALGMDAVILTGGCSDPLYRRASRVSMGTVFQIPWTMLSKKEGVWPTQTVSTLRELGFKTAAMALKEDSVGIDNRQLNAEDKLAIILGTEGDGLARDTIADCDYTVMIPMAHGVDSLNVAAAGAVAFWQLGNGCSTGK
mgnify:FL=1